MKTTNDYKFEVSISTERFDHKPNRDTEIPNLHFTKKAVDVDEYIEYMLEGYCYAGVYSYDSFDIGQKDNENYRYSYLVTIDVDHSHETMNEMVDRIEFKPTFAYTSCRDGLNGESRFRLVYAFDEKIEGKIDYYNLVYSIFTANGVDIEKEVGYRDKKYDKKSDDAIQFYNGNGTENFDFTVTDIIYYKEDFKDYYKQYHRVTNSKSVNENYIHTHTNNIHLNDTFKDKQFEDDFYKLKIEEILSKYIDVYPNLEHTPLEIPDDDTPYIIIPTDYVEIKRLCKVGKEGKYIRVNDGSALKIKDGQGRRRTLFWNGILRRLINPNITFDNLVYNLLYELCYYISNYKAENIIGKKEIYQIAVDVMKQDMSKYEHLRGTDKQFIVNRNYCIKYGKTKNEVKPMAAKLIRYNHIGELYDCNLTDKENLDKMKENGMVISLRTLKRWREENGITKYKKRR